MSLFVAFLLASASTTQAAPVPAVPTVAPAPAKPVKVKKICKTDDGDPGSHFVKRICLTEDEWAQRGQGGDHGSRSSASMSGEAMQGH